MAPVAPRSETGAQRVNDSLEFEIPQKRNPARLRWQRSAGERVRAICRIASETVKLGTPYDRALASQSDHVPIHN